MFSKSIDNCAHPSQARCRENLNRGGVDQKEPEKKTPTTTPFPEFDYDYFYYYDDEEYTNDIGSAAVKTTVKPTTKE